MWFIIQAMIIGFAIASPGGSIGFLCVEEVIKNGVLHGLASGLGAATADMLYGVLVAIFFKAIHTLLVQHQTLLSFVGALSVCYLGVKKFFDRPSLNEKQIMNGGLLHGYIFTFFLTMLDFGTIAEYACLFTGLDIDIAGLEKSLLFVVGVFLGSIVWWAILSFSVGLYRKKISEDIFRYINYSTGLVILLIGVYALTKNFLNKGE